MSTYRRPLVLVHGLWDDSQLFCQLLKQLSQYDMQIFALNLPHRLGRVSLKALAEELDHQILELCGSETSITLLGFSMGGIISRVWLQQMNGASRTDRFISVGSPHYGTLLAQLVPHSFFAGVAEMKRGSSLLSELNNDLSSLKGVICTSFFCRWDLMVVPGWQAVLPVGSSHAIPVSTHKELITHPKALQILVNEINQ